MASASATASSALSSNKSCSFGDGNSLLINKETSTPTPVSRIRARVYATNRNRKDTSDECSNKTVTAALQAASKHIAHSIHCANARKTSVSANQLINNCNQCRRDNRFYHAPPYFREVYERFLVPLFHLNNASKDFTCHFHMCSMLVQLDNFVKFCIFLLLFQTKTPPSFDRQGRFFFV